MDDTVTQTTTRYLYDGEDILYELDENNQIVSRFTHGPGIDDPILMERGSNVYYYHTDGLGSITKITNESGTEVRSYTYDSFGNIVSPPGSIEQPYTFTGRERDPESGLYYYRARYYDPVIGRFLSEDPIGLAGGDINYYTYVGNNPINWVDPLGLQTAVPIPAPIPLPPIPVPSPNPDELADAINTIINDIRDGIDRIRDAIDDAISDDDIDECDEEERCKKVKDSCIDECSETSLPSGDHGFRFWNCVNDCMRANGCL